MSANSPVVVVLYGGVGSEREVSLQSGRAVLASLEKSGLSVIGLELQGREVPAEFDPKRHLIFPVLHGEFGEDGQLQRLLEEAGFLFVGCDARSSALCIHKLDTKKAVAEIGVPCSRDKPYEVSDEWESVKSLLGKKVVGKPVSEGSSQGLFVINDHASWSNFVLHTEGKKFLLEEFIEGVDVTVGVLDGKALGVVKILPEGGVYDFERKYSQGKTQYEYPARLPDDVTNALQDFSQRTFSSLGLRDFCRVDYRVTPEGAIYFLEVNTIPGMTATSLFPKSASCLGYNFDSLCATMIAPALTRFSRTKI